jgi:hypothetical protein
MMVSGYARVSMDVLSVDARAKALRVVLAAGRAVAPRFSRFCRSGTGRAAIQFPIRQKSRFLREITGR